MDVDKLTLWIRKRLLSVTPKCATIRLLHLVGSAGSSPATVVECDVDSIIAEKLETEAAVQSISDEIWTAASGSIEAFTRPQQYAVQALTSAQGTIASMPFRLRPPTDGFPSTDETEPPTATGQMAMMMRHNESYARLLLGNVALLLTSTERRMAAVDAENERLRQERAESFALLESMRSEQHERDLETLKAVQDQENKEVLIAEAKKIVPLIQRRIAEKSLVTKLVGSMTDDQVGALATILRPEQLRLIGPALLAAAEKEESEKPDEPANKGD